MKSQEDKPIVTSREIERLRKDNENLSVQVKRLLRTEYDLYNTQLELDTQLSLYRELYETGKRISALKDFDSVFLEMERFIIDSLNFGGFLLLKKTESSFDIIQSAGFCTEYTEDQSAVTSLPIPDRKPPMAENINGFFATHASIDQDQMARLQALCPFDTFAAHFLCIGDMKTPEYLLIVGNPSEEHFYSDIQLDSGHMVSLGNLVSLVETELNNQLYYQQLKEERSHLEIKVNQRTEELREAMKELKELNDKLEAESFQDALTGLYNRRGFFTFGEKFLQMARRQRKQIIILYCDLDKFKPINDRYGHKEGDLALQATADIIKSACRTYDIISRFGGDEFVILFDSFKEDDFQNFLSRFDQLFDEYNKNSGKSYNILISYGYTMFTPKEDDDISFDSLIEKADKKLYSEKKRKIKEY